MDIMTRPAIVWEEGLRPVGDEADEWGKLLGTVLILGVPHHIEAWAVVTNEETGEQEAVDPWTSHEAICNEMTEGAGRTVTINGRDYFMVVTPYQL